MFVPVEEEKEKKAVNNRENQWKPSIRWEEQGRYGAEVKDSKGGMSSWMFANSHSLSIVCIAP